MGDYQTWPEVERRREPDRRGRSTRFFGPFFGPRRRRRGRRQGEDQRIYVDIFNPRDVLLAAVIFALNAADALFTLIYLQNGGTEGNPAMAWALEHGPAVFLFEKLFVVGFWLFVLILHKTFPIARYGLWMLLVAYSGVFVYHIYLIGFAPPPPEMAPAPTLVVEPLRTSL